MPSQSRNEQGAIMCYYSMDLLTPETSQFKIKTNNLYKIIEESVSHHRAV